MRSEPTRCAVFIRPSVSTMSAAQSFLDDFEEISAASNDFQNEHSNEQQHKDGDEMPSLQALPDEHLEIQQTPSNDRESDVWKFIEKLMQEMDALKHNDETMHALIVQANKVLIDIENEIHSKHKLARDIYAQRFLELERLVSAPKEYATLVKVIGNRTDVIALQKELAATGMPQNILLTITVTITTSIGSELSESTLRKLFDACDSILSLEKVKQNILQFIAQRMNVIAPNLSALIGTDVAAVMMGLAGGIKRLAEIPACNIQVIGVNRRALAGLSATGKQHMGVLTTTKIMMETPVSLWPRTIRLLANKTSLAARIDASNSDPYGSAGRKLSEEVHSKIRKWQEPSEIKIDRALRVPDEPKQKRRGGRKFRAQRERNAMTELEKQRNRLAFGKPETVNEYTGEGYGMVGSGGSGAGAIRIVVKDNQKLQNRLSKKTKERAKRYAELGKRSTPFSFGSNMDLIVDGS